MFYHFQQLQIMNSLLFDAVTANDLSQVDQLLKAGGDAATIWYDATGRRGLLYHSPSADMTRLLLFFHTPLFGGEMVKAICDDDPARVRLLLDAGAFQSEHLPIAAHKNSMEMVSMFLPFITDVNHCCHAPGVEPHHAQSALHFAAGNDNLEMVDLLLRHGADPRILSPAGFTALHKAALHGASIPVARRLLDAGTSLVSRNYIGRTSLHIAAQQEDRTGLLPFLLQLVLEAPGKFPHPVFDATIIRESVLSLAVSSGHIKNVVTILHYAPAAVHAKLPHPIEQYVLALTPPSEKLLLETILFQAKVGGNAVQGALVERGDMRACFAALGHAPNGLMGRYTWADPVREAIMMHLVSASAAHRATINQLCSLATPLDCKESYAKRAR